MAIEIEYEKVHERGVMGVRILGVKALKPMDLPEEYFEKFPYTYLDNSEKYLYFHPAVERKDGHKMTHITVGTFLKAKELGEVIQRIRACGSRLKEINDRIRAEKKKWHGKRKVII